MDATTGMDGRVYELFPPRATIPPQENPWDTGDNSGMEPTQIQRQIQHRACLGKQVSTVALLTCSNRRTLWEGWWPPPAMLPTLVVPTWCGKARSLVVAQPAGLPSARQRRAESQSSQPGESHLHLAQRQLGSTYNGSLILPTLSLLYNWRIETRTDEASSEIQS